MRKKLFLLFIMTLDSRKQIFVNLFTKEQLENPLYAWSIQKVWKHFKIKFNSSTKWTLSSTILQKRYPNDGYILSNVCEVQQPDVENYTWETLSLKRSIHIFHIPPPPELIIMSHPRSPSPVISTLEPPATLQEIKKEKESVVESPKVIRKPLWKLLNRDIVMLNPYTAVNDSQPSFYQKSDEKRQTSPTDSAFSSQLSIPKLEGLLNHSTHIKRMKKVRSCLLLEWGLVEECKHYSKTY